MPRLDQQLVSLNLSASRARAQRAIIEACVEVNGVLITKPAFPVEDTDQITINDPTARWVSRAALKILNVLEDHSGAVALDLGASTGGFSQALLAHGVRKIFAIDVGHDQMHPSLRTDPRIQLHEGVNVKSLSASSFDDPDWPDFHILCADLSFISLQKALPAALALAQKDVLAYLLVKPQFEVERDQINKAGIVKSQKAAQQAVCNLENWLNAQNWETLSLAPTPIKGGDGNQEYMLKAIKK